MKTSEKNWQNEKIRSTHILLKEENHNGKHDFISLVVNSNILQFRTFNFNRYFESKKELIDFLNQKSHDYLDLIEDIKDIEIPDQDLSKNPDYKEIL